MRRFLALAAITALATMAPADRVTLSNGRVIEGRILSTDDRFMQVDTGGLILRLEIDSVISVEKAEPYTNTLLRATTALRRRNMVEGIELLFVARREGAPDEDLRRILLEHDYRLTQAIDRARPDEYAELRGALRALLESDIPGNETFFDISHQFFRLNDIDAAVQALNRIPRDQILDNPVTRDWALKLMGQQVKQQLAQGSFHDALLTVEGMRRLGATADDPEFPLAHLSRSAEARERGDYANALRILIEDLHPLTPEIARNRLVHTVESLKLWAERTKEFDAAVEAIAPLEQLYPVIHLSARNHLAKLRVEHLMANGQSGAALEVFAELEGQELPPELTELRNRAYHEHTMKGLDETRPLELLKHGQWAAANGLLYESILIFERTRTNPNLRELSDQLLANATREYDTKLLEEAQILYDQGDMLGTRERTLRILKNPDRGSRLRAEAERLDKLAETAIDREEELRGPRAEVNFQQAERAFFMQDYEQSLKYINTVLNAFPETPAAARAARMLPDVVRALEISYLEGRTDRLPDVSAQFDLEKIQESDRLGQEVRRLLEAL